MKIYPSSNNIFFYEIDENDIIVNVSKRTWNTFYMQNVEGNNSCLSYNLKNTSLWKYITNQEMISLYKLIIENIRKYKKSIILPFRCDSDSERRYLDLEISPIENKKIQFKSKIVATEKRDKVNLFDDYLPKMDISLNVCSMCKFVEYEKGAWCEVELAIEKLNLFNMKEVPKISHSLCPFCLKSVEEKIQRLFCEYATY